MNNYRSNDDLLADADDVAERDDWGVDDIGDLLAADKMDIEYLCSLVEEETEEDRARREWRENWPGSLDQHRYNYIYLGIRAEGYVPSEQDEIDKTEVDAARKNAVKVYY